MSFGKPRLTDKQVFCLNCCEQYPEHDATLKHAGRTVDGDFWNTKCPHCGVKDQMVDVDGRSWAELREELHDVARWQQKRRKGNVGRR